MSLASEFVEGGPQARMDFVCDGVGVENGIVVLKVYCLNGRGVGISVHVLFCGRWGFVVISSFNIR